jgi:UDP-glucose 4-epimerase
VLENWRSGHRHNLAGFRYELIEGSILDRETVRRAMAGVDYVFHLAAMISVPESMRAPVECNALNATGTLIVLEEAAKAGVKKLVLSSSAAIYGDNPVTPKRETMLPEPKSPYAITKLDGEYYCKLFTAEGRLATTSLRYFNVFGPRQDPQSAYAAAVPIFIDRAVKQEAITIYGDGLAGDGRVQRGGRPLYHDPGAVHADLPVDRFAFGDQAWTGARGRRETFAGGD